LHRTSKNWKGNHWNRIEHRFLQTGSTSLSNKSQNAFVTCVIKQLIIIICDLQWFLRANKSLYLKHLVDWTTSQGISSVEHLLEFQHPISTRTWCQDYFWWHWKIHFSLSWKGDRHRQQFPSLCKQIVDCQWNFLFSERRKVNHENIKAQWNGICSCWKFILLCLMQNEISSREFPE